MRKTFGPACSWAAFYGPNWDRYGVCAEHVHRIEGGVTRIAASGAVWVHDASGVAFRVVCGDIIPVRNEDGPGTGRCGLPVVADANGDFYGCPGHNEERLAWQAMSEADKLAWEKATDDRW